MTEPHEIPDVAAEAAQGGIPSYVRDGERGLPQIDVSSLGALIDEIEVCRIPPRNKERYVCARLV